MNLGFSLLDWGIVVLYLGLSLFLGLKTRSYIKTMSDFIGAGRRLGTCLGIATLTGTEMGLITIMYSAQKGFLGGFAAFHIALVAGIVTFLVGVTGFIVAPLRAAGVLTIPEYYEQRFGKKVRILGGIMLALGGILNMGLFLKVGAVFLVGITGLPETGWALPVVMIVLLSLVLVYTMMGGMLAVVITDFIQFVILSVSLIAVSLLFISTLGWNSIFETVVLTMGRAGVDPFVSSGEFGLSYVLWMIFTAGLVSCAIWPTAVARALAAKSVDTVKRQYRWSSLSFMIRFLIPYFWGISAFVFIQTLAPDLASLDSLVAMPVVLAKILPVGILGLVTAAMLAAFMSTHDSYLLCWASVITQDIVAPLLKKPLSDAARIRLTRVFIFVIGLYILYWGLAYQGKDDIWDYMAVTGAIYFTGAFAVLVGGLYWKRASAMGAFLALITGLTALLGLEPIRTATFLAPFSSAEVGLISVSLTVTVMILGSLFWPDQRRSVA